MNHLTEPPTQDVVYLQDIHMRAVVGLDAWHRGGREQSVILSLRIHIDIHQAAEADDVGKTVHYGDLRKAVTQTVSRTGGFETVRHLAVAIVHAALGHARLDGPVELNLTLPEGSLLADGVGVSLQGTRQSSGDQNVPGGIQITQQPVIFIRNLRLACILGVNPHERLEKQPVVINLWLWDFHDALYTGYAGLVRDVAVLVEASKFETLEALTTAIAKELCTAFSVERLTVAAQKPRALMFVDGAGVEITRSRASFAEKRGIPPR